MPAVTALTAPSAHAPLTRGTVYRRDPGPHDVQIEIRWAGICHSDIHTVRGDWGPVPYPLTVGHEIAGVVSAIGDQVTAYAVGDRVGVGCMVGSCRECENCRNGFEQHCRNGMLDTYNGKLPDGAVTQGGYSRSIVVDENYVLRIPENLPFEKTAPLLCAGITTYSPLRQWGAGPGKRVAIVGMGGLGHMGVKLAHAMGAEVTVLSQTLSKKEDGLRLGADHYHATGDPQTFAALRDAFDIILNTVSVPIDHNEYLRLLRFDGVMVSVGVPPEPASLDSMTLFDNRRIYTGSKIGGIEATQEMLDFCGEHGIVPEVEIIGADEVTRAWENVLASKVRYRYVIDISTLS
ncbi:NAD(P)-dependent alcohol dehydrogenase [Sediminivirga luteola]|uniref:alcohol dehydrogenase (NADP(+)) n=1 Tax=Sediminivirga luteola TaxID=1774748 RepID=A0A8J2TWE4_9MICO|nr:NAD(P)-dependent alcohol dehydrogenase [Sediminivirga luteola]GGA07674.1 NADP-dependent alcohol dehydrogenase C [Sediminivirga luteola]